MRQIRRRILLSWANSCKMGAYLVPPNMNLWQHLTHILACLVAITPVSHPTDEFDIIAGCYRIPVKRTGDKVLWDFCQIGMVSEHRNLEILWYFLNYCRLHFLNLSIKKT